MYRPGSDSGSTLPPCSRITSQTKLKPKPAFLPALRVVTKGLNIRAIISRLMPGPLSRTVMVTASSELFVATVNRGR